MGAAWLPVAGTLRCLLSASKFTARIYIALLFFAAHDAAFAVDALQKTAVSQNDMALSDTVLIETGRRLYEQGVLADGRSLQAHRPEGFVMEGEYAACVTCHRRSGMGSVEGVLDSIILVPPVAGPVLFAPARFANSFLDKEHHYVPTSAWERALKRPAYDEQAFARALRQGLDPAGKKLLAPMPVYDLDDHSIRALAAYLQQLSSQPSPGYEANVLHIATVVTPDVAQEQVDAVLAVMQAWAKTANGAGVPLRLKVWVLSGPAATWKQQLDSYYQSQPVFALVSGTGGTQWAPVHVFCEHNRVACVLPSIEVAPDSGNDWYSIYYSPGVGLEASILARHIKLTGVDADDGSRVIQLYSDASGRHAATVLRAALADGKRSVMLRKFRDTAPGAAMRGVTSKDIMVMWLRPDEIELLVAGKQQGSIAESIYLSSMLATPAEVAMPASWKPALRYVSLFDDLGLQGEIARQRLERWLEQFDIEVSGHRRVLADVYAACYLFEAALANIHRQEVRRPVVPLRREHVIEMLETLVNKYDDSTNLVNIDSHVAWYGRMSLGPRQRVAVRGGAILRYDAPDSDRLVPVSKRIVP